MIKVSPSILSGDFSNLYKEVVKLQRSDAEYIHIDVMDGHFVSNLTIGPPVIHAIRPHATKVFDVHLMVSNPEKYIDDYINAGANILGIHHEVEADKIAMLQEIRRQDVKACIVFNPNSDLQEVEVYLPYVDQILLMSVYPGFAGQKFIKETYQRGRFVKEKIEKSPFEIDLQVDGGVTIENSKQIREAGFNVIVAGTAIYGAEKMNDAINALKGIDTHDLY